MQLRAAFNYGWTISLTGVMSAYGVARQLPGSDPELFRKHTRFWARSVARGIGLRVDTFGLERIDATATYILMANHQSHVDIVTLFTGLPMVPGFLAKAELSRVPVFGRAMKAGGHVFVERGQHREAIAALDRAAEDLRRGGSIVIFPEGTRSRRREVLPFKKGGFHLAKKARVPVVPIGLRGTADILPKHENAIRPGRVEVHIGEPIQPETFAAMSVDALSELVRDRICELSALPAAADRSGA
ncbi:MAG: lysophospholipid acyltransferase family protein [Sandaracinaceae bacterium]